MQRLNLDHFALHYLNIPVQCQGSISSTFYAPIFCTKVCQAAFFYLHVTREKLPKRFLYEKFALKMLLKLTPDGNGVKTIPD